MWNGQLGITRFELTLYRKGKDPTTWPIKCLRRYGYDADLFTFEAGRRCMTGEGIYAFRCRQAESLFQTLQSYIQLPIDESQNQDSQTMTSTNGPLVIPRNSGSSQHPSQLNQTPGGGYYIMNRPTSQNISPSADTLTSEGNYLDPTPNRNVTFPNAQMSRFQTGMRINSVSSGPMSPDPHSPGSPSSITDILEVTQLNPLPITNPANLNLYQEFPLREHNNNSSSSKKLIIDCPINLDCPPAEPAPSLNLSVLRREFGMRNVTNDNELPMSLSPTSTTLPANDSLDNSHIMYMNIVMGEPQQLNKIPSGSDTPKIVQTPNTTGSMFGIPRIQNSQYSIDANRLYENLEPGDIRPLQQRNRSKPDIFAKVELPSNEKSEPSTPTNHRCVYIQLDLEQISSSTVSNSANNSTSSSSTITSSRPTLPTIITTSITSTNSSSNSTTTMSLLPPDSPKTGILDYATIDFNKTNALSNSTTPSSELDSEGSRKTRHSSVATFGPAKHSNSVSD